MRWLQWEVLAEVIDAYITEDFISDVLAVVFAGEGRDYDSSSSDDESEVGKYKLSRKEAKQVSWGLYDDIEAEVLPGLIKEWVASDVVAQILDEYLTAEAAKRKGHPLLKVLESVVGEVVSEEVRRACAGAVDEVVKDYVFLKECKAVYRGVEDEVRACESRSEEARCSIRCQLRRCF